MNKLDLQTIAEQIDRLASAKTANPQDKIVAYHHKILQLLLQDKTTALANQTLTSQNIALSQKL